MIAIGIVGFTSCVLNLKLLAMFKKNSIIQTQFKTTVKTIRTDNGPELFLKRFFSNHGIIHQTSCVDSPQQNDIVERKHQHLSNIARSLLFQSKLPKKNWAHALNHAVYLINKLLSFFYMTKLLTY